MKPMTEREAWLMLAENLKQRNILATNPTTSPFMWFSTKTVSCLGLCVALVVLRRRRYISTRTHAAMKAVIVSAGGTSRLIWSTTLRGHAARRRFCLRQARLCAQTERPRK